MELCLVSVFPDIVEDCPKIRNLPNIFLRSFENVAPGVDVMFLRCQWWQRYRRGVVPAWCWRWSSVSHRVTADCVSAITWPRCSRWPSPANWNTLRRSDVSSTLPWYIDEWIHCGGYSTPLRVVVLGLVILIITAVGYCSQVCYVRLC